MDHTGLGMHYVFGIDPARGSMPGPVALLEGQHEQDFGYKKILVDKCPGTRFNYSGGGFVLLQHILEVICGEPIADAIKPFLSDCGMGGAFSFEQVSPPHPPRATIARGFLDDGTTTRLMFPPLAAGGHGTPTALANFLACLASAYRGASAHLSGDSEGHARIHVQQRLL